MSGVNSFVLLVKSELGYTFLTCTILTWSGFRQVARAIEGGNDCCVVCLKLRWSDDAAAEQQLFAASKRGRP